MGMYDQYAHAQYLEAIRQRVCAKCIDRTPSGICVAGRYEDCALIQFLPQIVKVVTETRSDRIDDYISALRNEVCSECKNQSPEGICQVRDEIEFALDRYYPLVIEAIEEQLHLKWE